MRRHRFAMGTLCALTCSPTFASAGDLKVVVTSKPIHSLAAAVMDGVGVPKLLVEGSASPHSFALKPSGASAINAADVFFRVSGTVEPFSEKISAALPASVALVTLAETPGLTLLDRRTGATFDEHEAHAGHDTPAGHGDHDDDTVAHGAKDGHVWLDPENAKLMAGKIASVLSEKDPSHAAAYAANATKLGTRIDALSAEIAAQTKPVAGRPFIVFHDAYQYFEKRFGLQAAGSITVSPDVQPSAKRLSALRKKIGKLDAACVFAEPLFQPKLVAAVTEGTKARAGTLDPEGTSLDAGSELYFTLMRTMAANLVGCLKPAA
ncbi:MAG: zinc ABC transporter substrate-binding protein [Hyphomicrobiaceae bacterium]